MKIIESSEKDKDKANAQIKIMERSDKDKSQIKLNIVERSDKDKSQIKIIESSEKY